MNDKVKEIQNDCVFLRGVDAVFSCKNALKVEHECKALLCAACYFTEKNKPKPASKKTSKEESYTTSRRKGDEARNYNGQSIMDENACYKGNKNGHDYVKFDAVNDKTYWNCQHRGSNDRIPNVCIECGKRIYCGSMATWIKKLV